MSASTVIGQTDFAGTWLGVSNSNLYKPFGVTYDSTRQRLFVSDMAANRVLVFDVSNLATNGISAQNVLGQTNFMNFNAAISQNGMDQPVATAFDPVQQRLFVVDSYRVTVFNLWGGVTNGMNATAVLGQPDFTTHTSVTSQNHVKSVSGVSYDPTGRQLFITDAGSNRVMIFNENNLAGTPDVACSGNTDYTICGSVASAEDNTVTLPGVAMELRDAPGKLLSTKKSDSSGNYTFGPGDGLTANNTYYVTPVLGRTQSASPFHVAVVNLQTIGATANFQVRGWPGTLKVNGPPGSPILISTSSYSGTDAPSINPTTTGSAGYHSAAIGWDGTTTLQVPTGTYYLTCWKAQASGSSMTHLRAPSSGSQGPSAVAANQVTSIACP